MKLHLFLSLQVAYSLRRVHIGATQAPTCTPTSGTGWAIRVLWVRTHTTHDRAGGTSSRNYRRIEESLRGPTRTLFSSCRAKTLERNDRTRWQEGSRKQRFYHKLVIIRITIIEADLS